ncbi:putative METAL CATION TRANSPORTER P-TYPE ATPASE CTPV domain protein, partial [Mycobacterium xenopi 4042]
GIEQVLAEVLPHDKVTEVRDSKTRPRGRDGRRRRQRRARPGAADGHCDRHRHRRGHRGIRYHADVRPLDGVVHSIELSRLTLRTIYQNLGWAFGYNTAAIPLAALGVLNPIVAGAAMDFPRSAW